MNLKLPAITRVLRRAAFCALLSIPAYASAAAPLRIDLNADNDRKDQLTPGRENWRVPTGPEAAMKFGDVNVTLRPAGGASQLATVMWKTAYDFNATLTGDGVVADADRDGRLQLVITGLAPGKHSLVSYHNLADDKATPSAFSVDVNGQRKLANIKPTTRVTNDADAAAAYVEFEAKAGEDVVVTYTPDGTGRFDSVVINAIELDVSDPARKALKPAPLDRDFHAEENPVLKWTAAPDTASHRVFLGTDESAVRNADEKSAEFLGESKTAEFATKALSVAVPAYFWRVDQVATDGTVTKGDVWSFRVRRLAFPGAEGYGRFAIGGRGGKVYNVTSLEDSGPGTLREAVEAEGPRTVVFRVGGTIQLKSKLVVRNPYITIAGQTAPGDGICVRGYTFGFYGTTDGVIRYLRVRVGDESGTTMDGTGFASTDHSIMDHMSVSWSIDEAVSSRGAKNITFQRSIVAEALNIANHAKYQAGKGHSFAGSISGEIGSFHHNLVAHCAGRNWSLAGGLTRGGKVAGSLDLRNNVVYNWQHRTTDGGVKRMNFVGNLYIPGPATKIFHLVMPQDFRPDDPQLYYIAANAMEGKPEYEADNWKNGGVNMSQSPGVEDRLKSPAEVFPPHVTTTPVKDLLDNVLADVGANIPRHDSVDERVIRDVRSRSFTFKGGKGNTPGIIDSQKDVGGWPDLKNGDAPADADLDGIPDWYEKSHNLNPNDPTDGPKYAADGYTNLEHYLNWIVENGSIVPKN
jgi:hypothetical protein